MALTIFGKTSHGRWTLTGASGTYYVAVSGGDPGAYSLEVEEVPAPSQLGVSEPDGGDFPADTSTEGLVVVDGGYVTGVRSTTSDVDWFAVELEANTNYRFSILGDPSVPPGQQVLDINFAIYITSGNFLTVFSLDNGGGPDGNWEIHEWTPTEGTGTYYVAVGGVDTGAYSLEVEDVSAPPPPPVSQLGVSEPVDGDLPQDVSTTGLVVVDGAPVTGVVSIIGDRDWFAVELEATKTYRFKLLGDTKVPKADQVLNTFFIMLSPSASLIQGFDSDDGGGPDGEWENETWTPTEGTGTYYVAVGGDTGAYSLEVEEVM